MAKATKGLRPNFTEVKPSKIGTGDFDLVAARDVLDCDLADQEATESDVERLPTLRIDGLRPLAGVHIGVVLDDGDRSDLFKQLIAQGLRKFRDLESPGAASKFMEAVSNHKDKRMVLARLDDLGLLA